MLIKGLLGGVGGGGVGSKPTLAAQDISCDTSNTRHFFMFQVKVANAIVADVAWEKLLNKWK